jgi:hypothetical protein
MPDLPCKSVLWNQVLLLSETFEDPKISLEDLRQQLCAVEEGFSGAFDPAEDFPEFVTVRLCRSLQRALQRR